MSRELIIYLLVGLPSLGALNAILFGIQLKSFVNRTNQLASKADMDAFKSVIRKQMYAALVQIVLLGLPGLIYAYGLFSDILVLGDIIYAIAPAAVMIGLGMAFKKIEEEAKEIPVEGEDLKDERNKVVHCWVNSAFPDF